MKKFLLSMLTAVMAIAFVGCEYDDSELTGRVENLEGRVQTLEQLCQQMNTNITAMQAIINALQTQDAITAVTPITEGGKVIGYTITFVKGDPITIYHGQDGKDGANGSDGKDGKDGYTPTIGVAQDEDGEYYWTLDGEWLTDKDGNKIATSGKDGADGEDGTTEKGGMPELKIQGGYWYVSYDGGETWERLGRATGYDGSDGKDGANGDAFFSSVKYAEDDTKDYVEFVLSDGKTFQVPKYKAFKVEIISTSADYIQVGGSSDVNIKFSVEGCNEPTVVVLSDLKTTVSTGLITVKAPATRGDLDSTEEVTLMVSNGSTTVMRSVEITVADVVATSTADVETALADVNTSTIVLGAGNYDIELYTKYPARESLTIVGTEGTKVAFGNGQVRMALFKEFTLSNCEILRMPNKSWGHLVFGSGDKANGVYTISNCTFNGVGTQGIYINEETSGATYNIENCTFNGDFGGEGAVTIQAGKSATESRNAAFTVNVTGCTFNNIPTTSHKIAVLFTDTAWTLNTDVPSTEVWWRDR